ncbi:MAG: substrate-binding domain-containing protein [Sphaerochaetaceae bacterium]
MAKEYLYKKIESELIRRIQNGFYKTGTIIPGTKELAGEFGTSGVTIDRALSSMVERGYISRTARKGTVILPRSKWDCIEQENGDIAIILHEFPSPYFWTKALQGISSAAEQQQRHLIVGTHHGDFSETEQYIRSLSSRHVSGLIFVPMSMKTKEEYLRNNLRILHAAEQTDLPYIFFDRYLDKTNSNYVISNDYETSCMLTGKLLERGCEHPVCLTHLYASSFAERESGFIDTLKKHGFARPEDHLHRISTMQSIIKKENAVQIAQKIKAGKVDGILAVNADILIGTMAAIRPMIEKKHRPLFVNFDDVGMLRDSELIASAVQDAFEYGKLVTELLMGMVGKWNTSHFKVEHPFTIKDY